MTPLPYRKSLGTVDVECSMSNENYHSLPSISASGAKTVLEAPAKYHYELGQPRDPTPAMIYGSAAHSIILEDDPEALEVVDYASWTGKAARTLKEEALANELYPVLKRDYNQILLMKDAVLGNKKAADLLGDPELVVEQTIQWRDKQTGVDMRARPDAHVPGGPVIDLKTARDGSPDGFRKAVAQQSYHLQAAWYLNAVHLATGETPDFIWLVVEKDAPHLVSMYKPDVETLVEGFRLMDRALRDVMVAETFGVWRGYADFVATLSLPRWAHKKN